MDFIGKDYAKKQAGEFPKSVIVPNVKHNNKKFNKHSNHLFFTGDNLEVLRHLQNNYYNSIDIIYIDPPYNTGSDGFVYTDRFEYDDQTLKDMFGLNDEELSRLKGIQGKSTHSAWLTFMYPRLWLAKKLLKEDGVIFISIDDNEHANLKLLMDSIFGEDSLCGQYIWKRTETPANLSRTVKQNTEFILAYCRDKEIKFSGIKKYSTSNNGLMNQTNAVHDLEFPSGVVDTGLANGEYKKGEYGTSSYKITLLEDTEVKDGFFIKPVKLRGKFKWGQENLDNEIEKGTKISIRTIAFSPSYEKKEYDAEVPQSLIDKSVNVSTNETAQKYLNFLFGEQKVFSNPKPYDLVEYLISFTNKTDAVVLDFFAGSATTAEAVLRLNALDGGTRQFILAQLPEKTYLVNSDADKVARKGSEIAFSNGYLTLDQISRKRIELVNDKIRDESLLTLPENFDGGFKHYHIAEPKQNVLDDLVSYDIETSLFKTTQGQLVQLPESGFDDMIQPFSSENLNVEGDASGIDTIITTWMVSDGYKFDTEISSIEFAGYQAYYIDNNRLYLIDTNWGSKQTQELLNAIGTNKLTVQTIVIYSYSFDLESIKEIEIGLKQLDNKVNILKRY